MVPAGPSLLFFLWSQREESKPRRVRRNSSSEWSAAELRVW
jgi:hypothetical protein